VFLGWQAHFLHSHRRSGFILAGRSSGAEPGSESGLLPKKTSWLRQVRRPASRRLLLEKE
jgi:hypothetical protein